MEELSSIQSKLGEFPLILRKDFQRGRFIIAKKDIEANTLIFQCCAYTLAVLDSFKKRFCENCSQYNERGFYSLHCSSCSQVWFCSNECMLSCCISHSPSHGMGASHTVEECSLLKKLLSCKLDKHIVSVIKVLVKILLRWKEEIRIEKIDTETRSSDDALSFNDILMLASNKSSWTPEEVIEWRKPVYLIRKLFPDMKLEEEFLLNLISRIECNNFGLWTERKQKCYGRAIFPHASFFNHSCKPNCYTKIVQGYIFIYTNEFIEKDTELCIQYIDVNKPLSSRQEQLLQGYCFRCTCTRCELEKRCGKASIPKISYAKGTHSRSLLNERSDTGESSNISPMTVQNIHPTLLETIRSTMETITLAERIVSS